MIAQEIPHPEIPPQITIKGPLPLTEDVRQDLNVFMNHQLDKREELPEEEQVRLEDYFIRMAVFREAVERIGEGEHAFVHLAREDGKILGFQLMYIKRPKPGEPASHRLMDPVWNYMREEGRELKQAWEEGRLAPTYPTLGVALERQGEGIATRLLSARINEMRKRGITHFTTQLLTPEIVHIYQKLGARIITPPVSEYGSIIDLSNVER